MDTGLTAVVLKPDALATVLVFKEGVARGDDRSLREVIFRHRRRQRPFERASVPWIAGALLALEGRPDEVDE